MNSGNLFRALVMFFLLSFPVIEGMAQINFVSGFTALQSGRAVRLHWTIDSGQTCNGILVESAGEDMIFSKVGDIPGVCGSILEPVNYDYIDSFPAFNQTTYYRLELGLQGYSDTLAFKHSPLIDISHMAYPNPFSEHVEIVFENPSLAIARVEVYSMSGQLVYSSTTESDRIRLAIPELEDQLLMYSIRIDGRILSGKMVKVKSAK